MARLRDWEPRLVEYLIQVRAKPFDAGRHDCAQFSGGAVEAMTGANPAKAFRDRYASIKEGVLTMRRQGYDDHIAFAASLYAEIHPAMAHKGDIGVVDGEGGFPALGIVQGEHVYVLKPAGLALVSRLEMKRAFRV